MSQLSGDAPSSDSTWVYVSRFGSDGFLVDVGLVRRREGRSTYKTLHVPENDLPECLVQLGVNGLPEQGEPRPTPLESILARVKQASGFAVTTIAMGASTAELVRRVDAWTARFLS